MPHPASPRPRKPFALARLALFTSFLLVAAAPGTSAQAGTARWQPKQPPLTTPWTSQVGPDNALPDYPRPQMTRARWQNLNGLWDYSGGGHPEQQVLVPYPPESALSGVQRHDDEMTYRRTFEVPPDWSGQRVVLHFGAVDQRATVRVNGQQVAEHHGGYTGFSADVTDALREGGPQALEVTAEDRNERAPYPVGKQRDKPEGITYTGSSGIWQTVWMEPVPDAHITATQATPEVDTANPDHSAFVVSARTEGVSDERLQAVVTGPGGREVGRATGDSGGRLRIPVPHPRLWTPDDPYLYRVTVRLVDDEDEPVDEVGSYAGLRKISLVKDSRGRPRMALNGRVLFQHGPLDQGYWPDGLHTAPTDDALRFDLEKTKDLGFNMVRKHAKVEPARWYYWADKLGLLVWQDIPPLTIDHDDKPGENPPPSPEQRTRFEHTRQQVVDQLANSPSVVGWVPFNEGWGEFDTARVAREVETQDPTRLVDAASGVNCCYSLPDTGAGDVYDDHTYVGPGAPPVRGDRASADGEYGGLGLVEPDHVWPGKPNAYEMTDDRRELTRRYGEVSDALVDVVRRQGLSAAVYTQTSDVENEVNGLFTYDRRVLKPDRDAVREHNRRVIDAGSQD